MKEGGKGRHITGKPSRRGRKDGQHGIESKQKIKACNYEWVKHARVSLIDHT